VISQTKAELLKLRSTRTTAGLVIGMLALIILFGLLAGLLTHADSLVTPENQRGVLGVGSVAGVFSALTGVLLVTSEYRFGTIRPTFLFTPRRSQVIVAKLVASLLAGLVFGVVGEALGFGIAYACLEGRGIPLVLHGGSLTLLLLGTVAGTAFFGAIGASVAAIVRNQIGTIVGLLAWGFIVENLLFAFVPSVGRFTPGQAQNALAGLTTNHLLSPAAGAAVMIAWIVALSAAGLVLTARRDVG
jgi:ABC-2 type transport system permease protein